jgi:serine/threonine protein kinase
MELCDLDLHDYIYNPTACLPTILSTKENDDFVFVPDRAAASVLVQIRNIWVISSQLASGLAFIHDKGIAHRDLKPRNGICPRLGRRLILVLYSSQNRAWKITDFGITVVATSKQAQTTRYSRGTASYRAPELLQESPTYNNKVDIWALGCILVELAYGTRLFAEDWNVLQFVSNNSLPSLPTLPWPSVMKTYLMGCVHDLLNRTREQRPRAADVMRLFQSISSLLDPAVTTSLGHIEFLRTYQEWKDRVFSLDETLLPFLFQFSLYFEAREMKSAYNVWCGHVARNDHVDYRNFRQVLCSFADSLEEGGELGLAMRMYVEAFRHEGSEGDIDLLKVLKKREDSDASKLLKGRMATGPLSEALWQFVRSQKLMFDWNTDRELWMQGYATNRTDGNYQHVLRGFCEEPEDTFEVVTRWRVLVERLPEDAWLQERLEGSLNRHGDPNVARTIWQDLIILHPRIYTSLRDRLFKAIQWTGRAESTDIAAWMELVLDSPDNMTQVGQLKDLLWLVNNAEAALDCFRELMDKAPDAFALQWELLEILEWNGRHNEFASHRQRLQRLLESESPALDSGLLISGLTRITLNSGDPLCGNTQGYY